MGVTDGKSTQTGFGPKWRSLSRATERFGNTVGCGGSGRSDDSTECISLPHLGASLLFLTCLRDSLLPQLGPSVYRGTTATGSSSSCGLPASRRNSPSIGPQGGPDQAGRVVCAVGWRLLTGRPGPCPAPVSVMRWVAHCEDTRAPGAREAASSGPEH